MKQSAIVFAFVSCVLCSAANAGEITDLDRGTVRLLDGYSHKRIGTTDSDLGEITRADKSLVIHYDIGMMAGYHVHPSRKADFRWYRETTINGHKACLGIKGGKGSEQLEITIYGSRNEATGEPSNFWAVIGKKEDVADVLLIISSYEIKVHR